MNFLSVSVSIFALAAGMAASGGVFAQTPAWGGRGPGPAPFDLMDLDGSGGISAAEHAQFRAERQRAMAAQGRPMRNAANAPAFEAIDADGDGQISPGEMTQMRQARMANRGYGPGFGPRGPVGLGPALGRAVTGRAGGPTGDRGLDRTPDKAVSTPPACSPHRLGMCTQRKSGIPAAS